jgi:hypothetical protein
VGYTDGLENVNSSKKVIEGKKDQALHSKRALGFCAQKDMSATADDLTSLIQHVFSNLREISTSTTYSQVTIGTRYKLRLALIRPLIPMVAGLKVD